MSLGQLWGISIHHTTAYNPKANGILERFRRTLKAALISIIQMQQLNMVLAASLVLLGLRTAPKEGLEVSPAEMVYADPLVVPSKFFP